MTTSRRAARAALRIEAGSGIPPRELYDADAAAWHGLTTFLGFMSRHDWLDYLPAQERMGADSSPPNRRAAAALAWAKTSPSGPGDDLHRLRELGLIDDPATNRKDAHMTATRRPGDSA